MICYAAIFNEEIGRYYIFEFIMDKVYYFRLVHDASSSDVWQGTGVQYVPFDLFVS